LLFSPNCSRINNMATIISWTDETWNPITGCSKISDGCRNCYAERISLKFKRSLYPWTANHAGENVICHPERLDFPWRLKKPSRIFTNSMSDMFHANVPDEFLHRVFDAMEATPQHVFQCLTKRPERAATWPHWPANVWMGTSIEDQRVAHRVAALRECGAATKFISAEPLIGSLDIDLAGIDWIIVGGESGPGYRPMEMEWARRLRDIAVGAGSAYFFKQDAAFRTEVRPWLVEEDGTAWEWHQYPGSLLPPVQVLGQRVHIDLTRQQPSLDLIQFQNTFAR